MGSNNDEVPAITDLPESMEKFNKLLLFQGVSHAGQQSINPHFRAYP